MSAMKVTQLSTDEVNQTIIDNKLENIYVLTSEPAKLYRVIDMQIGAVLRHIRTGSAFVKIEVIKK